MTSSDSTPPSDKPKSSDPHVLVRLSQAFDQLLPDLLGRLQGKLVKPVGHFHLIRLPSLAEARKQPEFRFFRWNLPIEHAWPCNPSKTDQFIERAAQALVEKFGARKPQAVFVGPANPGSPDHYFKKLASNLRGRLLQVFPSLPVKEVEEQHPGKPTLFCIVGKEGLFAGMEKPRDCNGFFPGGSKYIPTTGDKVLSRAGAKLAEALHYLRLHRPALPAKMHWLELGAAPGGMTSELLRRGYSVEAVDPALMDPSLRRNTRLHHSRVQVSYYKPKEDAKFDALLCDMNNDPFESINELIRLANWLPMRGLAIFTVKLPRVETLDEPMKLVSAMIQKAGAHGLRLIAQTHLTYNRHEFTLFLERVQRPR